MQGRNATQQQFETVKMLQKMGKRCKDISKSVGMSTTTVYMMMKTNTFADYKSLREREELDRNRVRKTDTRPDGDFDAMLAILVGLEMRITALENK